MPQIPALLQRVVHKKFAKYGPPAFYDIFDTITSWSKLLVSALTNLKVSGEADYSREQILSFAKKAEYLGYNYLGVNDHMCLETLVGLMQ